MKSKLKSCTALVKGFRKDERGATALTFGLGMTMLMGAIGVGMDLSIASTSRMQAQNVADAVALNAATFWRDNERKPTAEDEGAFQDDTWYSAADIGMDFGNFIKGDVMFKVVYDTTKGEARVVIKGATNTTFTSFIGQDKVDFRASSSATFASEEIVSPVSVVVVADNSGSMFFDDKPTIILDDDPYDFEYQAPDDTEPRINGLYTALEGFMHNLEESAGEQGGDGRKRTVRTALLPYSSEILTAAQEDFDWGYISKSEIRAMVPDGATNSAPPMAKAATWMLGENTVHRAESGKFPLKFVIFMTDGMNTVETWVPEDGTNIWRRNGECSNSRQTGMYPCIYITDGISGYKYSSSVMRSHSYEEGSYQMLADEQTVASCTALKNDGVRIFTIGFALDSGDYYVNDWAGGAYTSGVRNKSRDLPKNYWEVGDEVSAQANALLSNCASAPEDFVLAANSQELDAAFANIETQIEKELIRLSR